MSSAEMNAALDAARAAAEIIRGFYQRNVKIEVKADRTPVTEADVRAEEAIRDLLTRRFPSYGFYGEETGKSDMDAENIWLVDPIDGTKSFVRDCPFFSTQIALMRGGRFVLGVSSAPAYGELAWAELGEGAFLDGRGIHVSEVNALDAAIVSGGNVRVRSEYGEVTFKCVEGKVPQGMIFVPYGPPTCHLMGRYTDGTGMPTSKGWEVEVEPVA